MAEQSLKDKTVRGVAWSGIDNVANYTVSFVVSIVLARLLSPEDYGLIGIILIFTGISEAIVNGGFVNALIRKKGATEADFNTVFITNTVISTLLYFILFFSAPFIASFFDRPALIELARVSSVRIIIGAMALVPKVILTKRIDFKTQTKITLISSITSGIVGIAMAFLGFGVWALVVQGIVFSSLSAVCLFLFVKWIPKFIFSGNSFRELFGFGWKVMVTLLIDRIWKEMYQVVVGKFYSPATLGQYTRAKTFSQLFSTNITEVIQRVTFPVLSEIQNNPARMISAYRQMIKVTTFISAVLMFAMGATALPMICCLIGSKWSEAALYLPLICIAGSLYPLHAINLNMLQVQGRSDILLILEIVKKTILVIPLLVCIFVGIQEMLIVNIFTGIICFFLNSYYTGKRLGYTSWMQIKDVAPSYGVAIGMALAVYFFKYLPISYFIIFPIQIVVGVVFVWLVCEMIGLSEYKEVKNIITSYIKKLKR